MDNDKGTAQSRYENLSRDRDNYLERARECSRFTIPMLIPESDTTGTTRFPTPYSGVGARGVNNLASKLLIALLPPNSPFFRLRIDDYTLKELEGNQNLKTDIEKGLSEVERAIMTDIEMSADRVAVFEALKILIVGGNCLLHITDEGVRTFNLNQYVVKRDQTGNILEIITKETLSPETLPLEIQSAVKSRLEEDAKTVELFTHVRRQKKFYVVNQEVKGLKVPNSTGRFPLDKLGYIALRFTRIDGENYGRSFCEEYLGDLSSLEYLTKSIVSGSAAAAKVLFLCNPNSTTRARKLAESNSGDIIEGNAQDVSVLQVNKFQDFRVASETISRIETRLQIAFLINASIRDAERVTAAEIALVSKELEQGLGGVYSILSQEFQLPYIQRKMFLMGKRKKLPILPDTVKPTVITGLEALGRGNDRQKIIEFLQTLANTLGAEVVQKYINVSEAISRLAIADGIEVNGLIKDEDEIASMQQQQQLQQVAQDTAKNIDPQQAINAAQQYYNTQQQQEQ